MRPKKADHITPQFLDTEERKMSPRVQEQSQGSHQMSTERVLNLQADSQGFIQVDNF